MVNYGDMECSAHDIMRQEREAEARHAPVRECRCGADIESPELNICRTCLHDHAEDLMGW